jgi:type IV conjugative transfer system protein TraE
MKRDRYQSEKDEAKASKARWQRMAFGLLAANILLAVFVIGVDTTEKTLVVPPTIERPFWVKGGEVSAEYLEEMARYLSSLVLSVTPKSVDGNVDIFMRYVAPGSYGATKAGMDVGAERLKRNSSSTIFYPIEYQSKPKKFQTVISGDFVTTVGKQVVSQVRRSWRFTYTFESGRLWVSEFVEVSNEHPFDKTVGDSASGDAGAQ